MKFVAFAQLWALALWSLLKGLMGYLNNPWVLSIVTGVISGIFVTEWYSRKTEKQNFLDGMYDLYMYLELVIQALDSYRGPEDMAIVKEIVVFQQQGRLYPKLLRYKKQDEDTKELIRSAMRLCHDDLHATVTAQSDLDSPYVIRKLSELKKLKLSVLKEFHKYQRATA